MSTAGADAPRAWYVAAALLFTGSAALTLSWCASMAAMPGMDMPGGWTMSMTWMRMPGQGWPAAMATFAGMWSAMMIAMMLPVLVPMLARYRAAAGAAGARLDSLTAAAACGYFAVWILSGVAAFPLGVALADAEMRMPALSRAVPLAGGAVIVLAGALQLTRWKARQLSCCRGETHGAMPPDFATAWRHGIRLGLRCCGCCAPLTAVLFVAGVMDIRAMVLVTAVITAERLAPRGWRIARAIGLALIAGGAIYLRGTSGL